jgi:hypothetical protein
MPVARDIAHLLLVHAHPGVLRRRRILLPGKRDIPSLVWVVDMSGCAAMPSTTVTILIRLAALILLELLDVKSS